MPKPVQYNAHVIERDAHLGEVMQHHAADHDGEPIPSYRQGGAGWANGCDVPLQKKVKNSTPLDKLCLIPAKPLTPWGKDALATFDLTSKFLVKPQRDALSAALDELSIPHVLQHNGSCFLLAMSQESFQQLCASGVNLKMEGEVPQAQRS
jgi:hypothetical protein